MALPFLKLMTNNNTMELLKKPNAFILLTLTALRAKRTNDISVNGLEVGEAFIGDHDSCGLSRREYRTALDLLCQLGLTSKKTTNRGTIIKILDKRIFDINPEESDQQPTNSRPTADQQEATNKSIRNKEIKENNIKEKKVYKTNDPYFKAFVDLCSLRKIENEIPCTRYSEMRDEYLIKLNWWQQVQACVNWCYDHGKKKLTTSRLRNWMVNSLKFQKDKEIKQLQYFQDRKFQEKKFVSPKPTPVWTPPL